MKLIIDIPEDEYNAIKNTAFVEDEKTIFRQNANDRKCSMGLFHIVDEVKNGTPIPDNAVTWVDFEHLRDKIIRLSCRYSIARERGCGGQVEWSDRLIKQEDVLKAFEEYQKGGK